MVDGGEPAAFKQYFSTWKEPEDPETACIGFGGRAYPAAQVAQWDIGHLHAENRRRLARSAGAAIGFAPDDSTGQKEIFRIEDMAPVPLDESLHGMFFAGDSYVIKYTYEKPGGTGYIVYFWQGSQSSQDEKAVSAITAVQMDDEVGGKAVQVRVVQGREPRHFIKMFGGKMVVFSGGKASGFRNVHDRDCYDEDGTRLFRVRGTCAEDVRATQVEEVAAALNSEDVFVLETKGNTWIWTGRVSEKICCSCRDGQMRFLLLSHPPRVLARMSARLPSGWRGLWPRGEIRRCWRKGQSQMLSGRRWVGRGSTAARSTWTSKDD